jgi:hypothetical protein
MVGFYCIVFTQNFCGRTPDFPLNARTFTNVYYRLLAFIGAYLRSLRIGRASLDCLRPRGGRCYRPRLAFFTGRATEGWPSG